MSKLKIIRKSLLMLLIPMQITMAEDMQREVAQKQMETKPYTHSVFDKQFTVKVLPLKVKEPLPDHVPLKVSEGADVSLSDYIEGTFLSVKQTLRVDFDAYRSQLVETYTPVYYDKRYLQLTAMDQKLYREMALRLIRIMEESEELIREAETLSIELNRLYQRGRPWELLFEYTPENSYLRPEEPHFAYKKPLWSAEPVKSKPVTKMERNEDE